MNYSGYVEAPEENGPTSSVEIELQKDLKIHNLKYQKMKK